MLPAAESGGQLLAATRCRCSVQHPQTPFPLCQMSESSLGTLNRELSSDIFQVGWKQEILSV